MTSSKIYAILNRKGEKYFFHAGKEEKDMVLCSKCKKRPAVIFISLGEKESPVKGLCMKCAQKIEAGTVFVNKQSTFRTDNMPFGGFKNSGVGKEGIKYAVKGNRIGDISHAIGQFVEKNGYSVVREFQGHGIGRQMHEDPGIPNYGKAGKGPRLEPGMTLAIEPMVIMGKPDILELDDGWTIITEDGTPAAHYENTILITEKEPEILTLL